MHVYALGIQSDPEVGKFAQNAGKLLAESNWTVSIPWLSDIDVQLSPEFMVYVVPEHPDAVDVVEDPLVVSVALRVE